MTNDPVAAALAWADLCRPDNPTAEVGRMTQDQIESRCLDAIAVLAAEVRKMRGLFERAWFACDETALAEPDDSLPEAIIGLRERAEQAEAALAALREQRCETCDNEKFMSGEGVTRWCALMRVRSCIPRYCGAWARREP